jgi:hypothetical protein
MKNLITPSYVFTPGGSGVGTIDTNIVNFDIKLLYAIVNVTREAIIYTPAISGRGYTSITGDTITLEFSTTGMSSGDILQFIYDSTVDYPSYVNTGQTQPLTNAQLATAETTEALRQIQTEVEVLKNSIGQTRVDTSGRLRVLLDSISASLTLATITTVGTVTTVTTVSTVTNQTQIGGTNANDQVSALRRISADSLLSKIQIT